MEFLLNYAFPALDFCVLAKFYVPWPFSLASFTFFIIFPKIKFIDNKILIPQVKNL